MLVFVCVIMIGVYNCNEFRGVYYKFEFLECNDEEWLKIIMVCYKGRSEKLEFIYELVDVSLILFCKCDYISKFKGGNK